MKKKFKIPTAFILFFFFLFLVHFAHAEEKQTEIKILIAGISHFKDYNEIKKILFKTEGLELSYDSSAQKLQTFQGIYKGEFPSLLTVLQTDLPPYVMIKEKTLPSHIEEITILPR